MPDPLGLLPRAWWSFSLPGFREHPEPGTYSPFAYDELPPIHVPSDPQFNWLLAKPVHDRWSLATNPYPDGSMPDLSNLPELVADAGVSFPQSFAAFIQDRRLHGGIRSSTACLLELGVHLVASSDPMRGALLHFLSDQQSCLHWCLLATTSRIHCVLVTPEPWGLLYSPGEPAPLELDLTEQKVWLCADSFEEFVYRFWLENEIWFRVLRDRLPATDEEAAYLDHYRALGEQKALR